MPHAGPGITAAPLYGGTLPLLSQGYGQEGDVWMNRAPARGSPLRVAWCCGSGEGDTHEVVPDLGAHNQPQVGGDL